MVKKSKLVVQIGQTRLDSNFIAHRPQFVIPSHAKIHWQETEFANEKERAEYIDRLLKKRDKEAVRGVRGVKKK